MRMKMFAAKTLKDAKAMIFAEMGKDAVILSEREVDGGVEVRAATDKMGGGMVPAEPLFMKRFEDPGQPRIVDTSLRSRVRDALTWHGAPSGFACRVSEEGVLDPSLSDPVAALEEGLSSIITCDPVAVRPERDIVLVGTPGAGRTAVAAKLTRRAAVTNAELLPVAADLDGAAGGEQLAAYLEHETAQIRTCPTPEDLFALLRSTKAAGQRCIIDLPAIVPFDPEDMAQLSDLLTVIDAEPVLVMSAEGHPDDLSEAARAFAKVGIKRAILTKLDAVRRRGGAVAALSTAKIAFSHLAATPFIGGGLVPAAPSRLAALLLEDAPGQVALRGAA
ncbi:MAG: flagellar biosynthesis protein FlhF-like protein [Pseudomonadota bacterium]